VCSQFAFAFFELFHFPKYYKVYDVYLDELLFIFQSEENQLFLGCS
jgi:hypothetical protein